MPCALVDTLLFKHGLRYGQTVVCMEVQQQNTAQGQIREAIPPNHAPPGLTVVPHMSVRPQGPQV